MLGKLQSNLAVTGRTAGGFYLALAEKWGYKRLFMTTGTPPGVVWVVVLAKYNLET